MNTMKMRGRSDGYPSSDSAEGVARVAVRILPNEPIVKPRREFPALKIAKGIVYCGRFESGRTRKFNIFWGISFGDAPMAGIDFVRSIP